MTSLLNPIYFPIVLEEYRCIRSPSAKNQSRRSHRTTRRRVMSKVVMLFCVTTIFLLESTLGLIMPIILQPEQTFRQRKQFRNCSHIKTVKTFELRKSNSNPLENALHLDCCFQPLGNGKALIHDQGFLDKSDFEWLLDFFGKDNVFIATQEEMSQMNCNVFSISKDVVISEQNFTRLNTWLTAQGFTVEESALCRNI